VNQTFTTSNGAALIVDDIKIADKLKRIEQAVGNEGWIDLRVDKRDGKLRQVMVTVVFKSRDEQQ